MMDEDHEPNQKQLLAIEHLRNQETNEVLYGGGARCFTPETLVRTSVGLKRIDQIQQGDFVLSVNLKTGFSEFRRVLKTFCFDTTSEMCIFDNGIKCTSDHEFFFRGKWTKAKKLEWGDLETGRGQLFYFKPRKVSDIKSLWLRKAGNHEASKGRKRLFENHDKYWREVKDYKNTQISSSSICRKPTKQTLCKSHKHDSRRQQVFKFRVGDRKRKLLAFSNVRQGRPYSRSSKWTKGRRYRYIYFKRKPNKRDKREVQTKDLHPSNVGRRIWSDGIHDQRCGSKKELEAREIRPSECSHQIIVGKFKTYDLHVEGNNNYCITDQNILVHNSGKSWLLCCWQLFNRLSMPESYGLIAREEMTKLKDTTLETFWKVCKFYGVREDEDYYYTQSPNPTVKFNNGSIIFFREIKFIPRDKEFDRLGSYDLTDVALDEAQQIHWKAREVLRGRLSVLEGSGWRVKPKAFYSCNPSKNWIYKHFVKPSEQGNLDNDKVFIPALARDNPYVGKDYIEHLRKADKVTRERLLEGNFDYDDDPSSMCDYDAICDMFTNDHVEEGNTHYISADLAMQGRDLFIAGHWKGLVGHVDIVKDKATAKEIEEDLKRLKIDKLVPNSRIVADADGIGSYLESYIQNIYAFRGGTRAGNHKEFFNLKSECAYKLAELINQRKIKIVCSEEQEEAIKDEVSICLKRDNVDKDETRKRIISKEDMKALLSHSPDYLDWLIMRMVFIVKPRKREPLKVKVKR